MNSNKQEDMKQLVDIIEDLVINSGWEISELTPEDIFDNFEITAKTLGEIINTAINIADRKITQAGEWLRELRHQ